MVGDGGPFRQQVEAFVRDRYALDPTAATIAGLHDHDARLADLSAEGFAARDASADRWLRIFEAHDPSSWSAPDRTDLALILGELRGERAVRPFERHRRQPSLYSDAITRGAYYALMREKGLLPYDAVTLKAWGEELYAQTAAQLADAARALGDTDWRDSVERLRRAHPAEDELVAAYRADMERSRAATAVAGLAAFPPGESLTVEAMPDFARPTLPYAAYVQPGQFERSRRGRFWVTLPALDEPDTVKEERLSGHPRKGIAVIACHEGYPGHHLQLATAADHPSLARKAIRSNVFIEGWGLYVEELMTELGFLDDPETRLLRLKDLLWRAARVSVDVGLSTGALSFEQAVRFMMDGPKLERPNAVGECRRYTLNPLQPSSYALGRAAILQLRERAQARGYGMRAFHDALLGCGSIPPPLAAAELGL